jgi:hypothetical protein
MIAIPTFSTMPARKIVVVIQIGTNKRRSAGELQTNRAKHLVRHVHVAQLNP